MSRRETILSGYAARLAAAVAGFTAPAGFERNRFSEVEPDEMPFLAMHDGDMEVVDSGAGQVDYDMSFEIEGYIKAASGPALGAAVSTFHAEVIAALWGADFTLAGIVQRLSEGGIIEPEFGLEDDAGFYAVITIPITVRFATAEGDPAAAP